MKQDGQRGLHPSIDSNTSLRGVDLSGFDLDADAEEPEDSGLTQSMLEILFLKPMLY